MHKMEGQVQFSTTFAGPEKDVGTKRSTWDQWVMFIVIHCATIRL